MRVWLPLLGLILPLLGGCLTPAEEIIPETWPEDPAIHPGMRLYFSYDKHYSQCTAGFMFASPDNQTLYLSVSAHCLHSDGDLKVGAPAYGSPPTGRNRAIGTIAFDGWAGGDESRVRDFALIQLSNREGVREKANPAVEHWGGPLGLANSQQALPGTRVAAYGNSINRADETKNPTLGRLVLTFDGDVRVRLDRDAIGGDSGGPLLTWDGHALGILHGGQTFSSPVGDASFDLFTPLDTAITMLRAEGAPGVREARLVTWDTWNGPGLPLAT